MKSRFSAYCGLYCGACYVMQANEKGRIDKIAKTLEIKPDDVKCGGCKSNIRFIGCRNCYIRSCAEEKGLNYCFECKDFSCDYFKNFINLKPHLISTVENLETMRNTSLDFWLKEQEEKWKCSNCHEKFSWYEFECEVCKRPVEGYNYERDPSML